VGLLGGSFNPAHEGHLHISIEALKRLKLDEVWWLVSPGNPLKPMRDMGAYKDRLASAQAMAKHVRIRVSTFEAQHNIRYTVDTLRVLRRSFPRYRFVWIMGADNLAQFHRWKAWRAIARLMPIAIFDRAELMHSALRKCAAIMLKHGRVSSSDANVLTEKKPPAWVFLPIRKHPESATRLRNSLGKKSFMRHN
jgi:nicotinate-nucleotide adenylyltransferase